MIDNISLYRNFHEVAGCGSISEAAQRLYMTQPAVSASVKQLEQQLGVTLFFRTNRGIRLTPEGELLDSYVRTALEALEEGEDKLREMTGLNSGLLRIGASDMTLRFYLLEHIQSFSRAFPGIRITISNAPSPATMEALLRGEIDFGVVSGPIDAGHEIETFPVMELRDIVVTASDRFGTEPVSFEELTGEKLIMLDTSTSTRRFTDAQLRKNKAPDGLLLPDIELSTSDLIIDFACRGIGIAFVPEPFAREAIRKGLLHEIRLQQPFQTRSFLIACRKKTALPAAALRFLQACGMFGEAEEKPSGTTASKN